MVSSKSFLFALIPFLTLTTSLTQPQPLPIVPIARQPPLKFENLVVRRTGQILTTTTQPAAYLYQVDPLRIHAPQQLHAFAGVQSATGIVESTTEPDVFYVAGGNFSLRAPHDTSAQSSHRISRVDLRQPNGPPSVSVVAYLPHAELPNGIALSCGGANLLVADSFAGLLWNVDLASGAVAVALNDSSTAGPDTSGPGITGANGLKIAADYLYWSNTGRSAVYRVHVDARGYPLPGADVETVAEHVSCDDLLVAGDGAVYVAGPLGLVTRVEASGEQLVVAGGLNVTSGPELLGGPSALAFGRLEMDSGSLYVTTNGGLPPHQINGTEGVSRIDVFRLEGME